MRKLGLFCILLLLGLCESVAANMEESASPSSPAAFPEEHVETTTSAAFLTEDNGSGRSNQIEARKKSKGGMEDVYMMLRVVESMVEIFTSIINPIFRVKELGLSAIDTFINIAQFVLRLKDSKMSQGWGGSSDMSIGDDRHDVVEKGPPPLPLRYPPKYIKRIIVRH